MPLSTPSSYALPFFSAFYLQMSIKSLSAFNTDRLTCSSTSPYQEEQVSQFISIEGILVTNSVPDDAYLYIFDGHFIDKDGFR